MILVDLYVPAVDRQYDFKLEEHVRIAELIEELGGMMIPASEDPSGSSAEQLLLCSYETERVLPLDQTLFACGIGNGSRLMLV